jgi:hypothetical protein
MQKAPANIKKLASAAVKPMQVYLGTARVGAGMRTEDKLYRKARAAVQKVCDASGMELADAWAQIEAEALRRGVIVGRPGKDY